MTSPLMMQWHACKKKAGSALLLFRLGDFYEAFYEDAEVLSRELDLTLTKRQEVPMSGVPFHTCENYIDRLVEKGYRVAVAEQIEEAKLAKGLVKRDVTRIVTPGTVVSSSLLSDKSNNFLASLSRVNATFGLALLDLTTAEFRVMELESEGEVIDELFCLKPAEILVSEKWLKSHENLAKQLSHHFPSITVKEEWYYDHRTAYDKLTRHFQVHHLDGFGLREMIAAINAAGALLSYVSEELNLSVTHISALRTERLSHYMMIDVNTQRHLELIHSSRGGKGKGSLLHHIDLTLTPMGGRLLREWLSHPLLSLPSILRRQEAISALSSQPEDCSLLAEHLREVRDLERLIMRIETGYASPRDFVGLRFSLERIAPIASLLKKIDSSLIQKERDELRDLSSLVETLKNALVDSPPLRLHEGGIFKTGYHPTLDELRALTANNHLWIANYQTELREVTQIKNLKVGFTRAFGYYIEVSRGQASRMPESFERRQTLANAERFTTPELKRYEHQVLSAEERMCSVESELFQALRSRVAKEAREIRQIAAAVASIDCLHSLSACARKYNYTCPLVDEGSLLQVEEGRHPIIEASLLREAFIPNDVYLDGEKESLLLITGPNMAGKSTYIRQVALIVILAQMGSFVPAKSAHIGIVDRLFSRIGASDDLARGQSTFMVEMAETAHILHHATSRSLVILDEIGRGTSTYDGISIAWSVAEDLLGKKTKTLFATHYWELTQLEELIPGAVNYTVAVHESQQGITFLHKIAKGVSNKSYGIHVARLAGLPSSVIKRAQEILTSLEREARSPSPRAKKKPKERQPDLFEPTTGIYDFR
jgi:DNA mismatch repair protein MutS